MMPSLTYPSFLRNSLSTKSHPCKPYQIFPVCMRNIQVLRSSALGQDITKGTDLSF